jgi:tetratricopeptide (TPR) repeat protein
MGSYPKITGGIMAKSKISRKKLLKEPDEFITFTGRLLQYGRTYQKQLIGVVIFFFLIIIVGSTVRYFYEKGEAEASFLLSKAQKNYEETLSSKGTEKALKAVEKDYQKLLNDYSGKVAGKQARILLANIYYDAKMIDKAIALYKVALEDWSNVSAVKNIILNSLGYAYEQKKELKTAVTYYEQIRKSDETLGKATAIYNLGRIYAKLNDKEKSMKAFQDVSEKYPDFIYSEIVKEKIQL